MIRPRPQRGFTLVEALVALVVLSIGLLGVAALQLSSLQSNSSAASRSQATLLAYEIVDRMRANQVAARNGEYDITFAQTPAGASVAQTDLIGWRQDLRTTLGPSATSQIVRNPAGTTVTYVISIQWSDLSDTGIGPRAALRFDTETQL
jgi:type IV pilus assembly protein PilV